MCSLISSKLSDYVTFQRKLWLFRMKNKQPTHLAEHETESEPRRPEVYLRQLFKSLTTNLSRIIIDASWNTNFSIIKDRSKFRDLWSPWYTWKFFLLENQIVRLIHNPIVNLNLCYGHSPWKLNKVLKWSRPRFLASLVWTLPLIEQSGFSKMYFQVFKNNVFWIFWTMPKLVAQR